MPLENLTDAALERKLELLHARRDEIQDKVTEYDARSKRCDALIALVKAEQQRRPGASPGEQGEEEKADDEESAGTSSPRGTKRKPNKPITYGKKSDRAKKRTKKSPGDKPEESQAPQEQAPVDWDTLNKHQQKAFFKQLFFKVHKITTYEGWEAHWIKTYLADMSKGKQPEDHDLRTWKSNAKRYAEDCWKILTLKDTRTAASWGDPDPDDKWAPLNILHCLEFWGTFPEYKTDPVGSAHWIMYKFFEGKFQPQEQPPNYRLKGQAKEATEADKDAYTRFNKAHHAATAMSMFQAMHDELDEEYEDTSDASS